MKLAARFGVDTDTARKAGLGETWQHVTEVAV